MLSSIVHFPLCLCNRKSNLSLSLVGCLLLLSMIARTVSDSLSNKTDLGTSVLKQQLGNVTSKGFLLDAKSFYSRYKSSAPKKVESAVNENLILSTMQTSLQFIKEIHETTSLIEQKTTSKSPSMLGSKERIFTTESQIYSSLYQGNVKSEVMPNDVITNSQLITSFAPNFKTPHLPYFYEDRTTVSTPISISLINMAGNMNSERRETTVKRSKNFIRQQSSIDTNSSHKLLSPISDETSGVLTTASDTLKSHVNELSSSISSTRAAYNKLNITKTLNFDRQQNLTDHNDISLLKEIFKKSIKYSMNLDRDLAKQSVSATTVLHKDSSDDTVLPYHLESSQFILSPKEGRTSEFISSSATMKLRPISTGTLLTSGQHELSKTYQNHRLSDLQYLQSSMTDNINKPMHISYILYKDDFVTYTDSTQDSYESTDFLKTIPAATLSLSLGAFPDTEIIASKTISLSSEELFTDEMSSLVSTSAIAFQSENNIVTVSPDASELFLSKDSRYNIMPKIASFIPVLKIKFYSSSSEDMVASNVQDTSELSIETSNKDISSVHMLPVETLLTDLQSISSTIDLFNSRKMDLASSFSTINFVSIINSMSTAAESSDLDTKTLTYESSSILSTNTLEISELMSISISLKETVIPSSFPVIKLYTSPTDSEFRISYLENLPVSANTSWSINGPISLNQKDITTASIKISTEINEYQLITHSPLLKTSRKMPSELVPKTSAIDKAKSTNSLSIPDTLHQSESISNSEILKSYKTDILPTSTKHFSISIGSVEHDRYSLQIKVTSSVQNNFEYFSGNVPVYANFNSSSINKQPSSGGSFVVTNIHSIMPSFSLGNVVQTSEQEIYESFSELYQISLKFSEVKTSKQEKFTSTSSQFLETDITDLKTAVHDFSSNILTQENAQSFSDTLATYINDKPMSYFSVSVLKSSNQGPVSIYSTVITANKMDVLKSENEPISNLRKRPPYSELYTATKTDKLPSYIMASKYAERNERISYTGKMNFKKVSDISATSSGITISDRNRLVLSISDMINFSSLIEENTVSEPYLFVPSIQSSLTDGNFPSPTLTDLKISSQSLKTVSLETVRTSTNELSVSSVDIFEIKSSSSIIWPPSSPIENDVQSSSIKNDIPTASFVDENSTSPVINKIPTFSAIDETSISSVENININDISSYADIYSIASSSFILEIESSSSITESPFSSIIIEVLTDTDVNEITSLSSVNKIDPSLDINETLSVLMPSKQDQVPKFSTTITANKMDVMKSDKETNSNLHKHDSYSKLYYATRTDKFPFSIMISKHTERNESISYTEKMKFKTIGDISPTSSEILLSEGNSFVSSISDMTFLSSFSKPNVILSSNVFLQTENNLLSPSFTDLKISSQGHKTVSLEAIRTYANDISVTSAGTSNMKSYFNIVRPPLSSVENEVQSSSVEPEIPSSSYINENFTFSVIRKAPMSLAIDGMPTSSFEKNNISDVSSYTDMTSDASSSFMFEIQLSSNITDSPLSSILPEVPIDTDINEITPPPSLNSIDPSSDLNDTFYELRSSKQVPIFSTTITANKMDIMKSDSESNSGLRQHQSYSKLYNTTKTDRFPSSVMVSKRAERNERISFTGKIKFKGISDISYINSGILITDRNSLVSPITYMSSFSSTIDENSFSEPNVIIQSNNSDINFLSPSFFYLKTSHQSHRTVSLETVRTYTKAFSLRSAGIFEIKSSSSIIRPPSSSVKNEFHSFSIKNDSTSPLLTYENLTSPVINKVPTSTVTDGMPTSPVVNININEINSYADIYSIASSSFMYEIQSLSGINESPLSSIIIQVPTDTDTAEISSSSSVNKIDSSSDIDETLPASVVNSSHSELLSSFVVNAIISSSCMNEFSLSHRILSSSSVKEYLVSSNIIKYSTSPGLKELSSFSDIFSVPISSDVTVYSSFQSMDVLMSSLSIGISSSISNTDNFSSSSSISEYSSFSSMYDSPTSTAAHENLSMSRIKASPVSSSKTRFNSASSSSLYDLYSGLNTIAIHSFSTRPLYPDLKIYPSSPNFNVFPTPVGKEKFVSSSGDRLILSVKDELSLMPGIDISPTLSSTYELALSSSISEDLLFSSLLESQSSAITYYDAQPLVINEITSSSDLHWSTITDDFEIMFSSNVNVSPLSPRKEDSLSSSTILYAAPAPSVTALMSPSGLKVPSTTLIMYTLPSYSDLWNAFLSTQSINVLSSSSTIDEYISLTSTNKSSSSLIMAESLSSDTVMFTTTIESSMSTQFLNSEIQDAFIHRADSNYVVTSTHNLSFSEAEYQFNSLVFTNHQSSKMQNTSVLTSGINYTTLEASLWTQNVTSQNASAFSIMDTSFIGQSSTQHFIFASSEETHNNKKIINYTTAETSMSKHYPNSENSKKAIVSLEWTSMDKNVIEQTFLTSYDIKEIENVSISVSVPKYVDKTTIESVLPNNIMSSDIQDSKTIFSSPSETLKVLSTQYLTSKIQNESSRHKIDETNNIKMPISLQNVTSETQVSYFNMKVNDKPANKLLASKTNFATVMPNVSKMSSEKPTFTNIKRKRLWPSRQRQINDTLNYSSLTATVTLDDHLVGNQTFPAQHQTLEQPTATAFTIEPTTTSSFTFKEMVSKFPKNILGSSGVTSTTGLKENELSMFSLITDIETALEFPLNSKTSAHSALKSMMSSKLMVLSIYFSKSNLIDTIATTESSFATYSNSQTPNASKFPSRATSFKEAGSAFSMSTKHLISSLTLSGSELSKSPKNVHYPSSVYVGESALFSEVLFHDFTFLDSSSGSLSLSTGATTLDTHLFTSTTLDSPSYTSVFFIEDIMSDTYSYFSEYGSETYLLSPFIYAQSSDGIPDPSIDSVTQMGISLSSTETGSLHSFALKESHDSDITIPVETLITEKLSSEIKLTKTPSPEKLISSFLSHVESSSSKYLLFDSSELMANTLHISLSSSDLLTSSMSAIDRMLPQSNTYLVSLSSIKEEVVTSSPVEIPTSYSLNSSTTMNGTTLTPHFESKNLDDSSFIADANEISEDGVIMISNSSYAINDSSNSVKFSPYLIDSFNSLTSSPTFSRASNLEASSQFSPGFLNSEPETSLLLSSLSTTLKSSVSILEDETLRVSFERSEYLFKLLDNSKNSFATVVESSVSLSVTDTQVSMANKDERTSKSELLLPNSAQEVQFPKSSVTSIVKIQSSLTLLLETTSSLYRASHLSSNFKVSSSEEMLLLTPTPSLKSSKYGIDMTLSTDQVEISSSKTVVIDMTGQGKTFKQSVIPSSRTLSPRTFHKTTPLPSLINKSSVSVQSQSNFTLSSFENENTFSSTASMDILLLSLSTSGESRAKLSPTIYFISSSSVIETSTSQLPSPRNIDQNLLLTIGIIVKNSVNIDKKGVNVRIKTGLERCYIEGVLKDDKEESTRRKRAITNVTAEVFGVKRKESAHSHVDVDFYILLDGIIQHPAELVVIFSRLSIAETSAYMSFPVTTPVRPLSRPKVQTPANKDDSNISMVTVSLIGAPTVFALMASVLFIVLYCRKAEDNFRKKWSTLHDADLKVDIEKGEVVSATVSRNKDIPQFSFDNGKDFGSVWAHFKPSLQSSEELTRNEKPFKISIKEMSSTSQRLGRLRNLGFHVSEIRKPEQQKSREVEFDLTTEKEQKKEGSFVHSDDGIDVINDLDKPTDQMLIHFSGGLIHEDITKRESSDCRRKPSRGQNGVTFQLEVSNSNASTTEFSPNIRPIRNDSLTNVSKVTDSFLYDSSDSATESEQFVKSKHLGKSKEVCSNRKKKKMKRRKKVKHAHLSSMKNSELRDHLFEAIQNKSPNSRPRIPSIPVEGYCNKVMYEPFYTSLTLSKDPLPVNNFIEGDLEDEVFITDIIPFQDHNEKSNRTTKPKTIPVSPGIARNLATPRPKRGQVNNKVKGSKSVIKREGVSNNNCDVIRKPSFDISSANSVRYKEDNEVGDVGWSEYSSFQSSPLQSYLKTWSDDPFNLSLCCDNFPDGSEYAGHEFESLNFNTEYTRRVGRDLHFEAQFPESTTQKSKMSEVVVTETFPGMYEHVTKMGRVGKAHKDSHYGRSAGPQFRKLPFQDQTIQISQTSSPVPSSTPKRSSPVIMREIPRLPFLPLYPTREIMKDTGTQTINKKKTEFIHGNGMDFNAKDIPKREKVSGHYEKSPSTKDDEQKKYKSKWVEVVKNKGWREHDFDTEGPIKRNGHYHVENPRKKDDQNTEQEINQKKYKNKWAEIVKKKDWKSKEDRDFEKVYENKRNSLYEIESSNQKAGTRRKTAFETKKKIHANDLDESIDDEEEIFQNSDKSKKMEKIDKEQQIKHKRYKSKWASVIEKKGWRKRSNGDPENFYESKRSMDDASDYNEISRSEYSTGKRNIDEISSDVDDETGRKYIDEGINVITRNEREKPKDLDNDMQKEKASRKAHRIGRMNTDKPGSYVDKGSEQKKGMNTVGRATDVSPEKEDTAHEEDVTGKETDQDRDDFLRRTYMYDHGNKDVKKLKEAGSKPSGIKDDDYDNGDQDEQVLFKYHEEMSNAKHATGEKTGFNRKTDQDGVEGEEIPVYNTQKRSRTRGRHSEKEEITPPLSSKPKVDSTPYVEMKLGRNMRAAPKGSLAAMSLPDANSQLDASVPLLHNHTLQSNDIAEYFANTHAALRPQTQGSGISSRQYPSRSITSPQHPSQDLIETLNRNNLTSLTQQTQETNLVDEQRKAAEHQERLEASLRALQEEQRRKQEEEEIRKRQRKAEAEQKLSHDFGTKNTLLNDTSELTEPKTVVSPLIGVATPPPPVDLYSSYRMSETYEQKTSEQASTQPFSPKDSSYFSRGGETTTTTTGSLKEDNSGNTAPKSKKQESTDDEADYDIEEDIEGVNNGSENEEIKDDDFDF